MSQEIHVNGVRFVSANVASDVTGLSQDHVSRLARSGKISATRIQKAWFIDLESLHSYIAQQSEMREARYAELAQRRAAAYRTAAAAKVAVPAANAAELETSSSLRGITHTAELSTLERWSYQAPAFIHRSSLAPLYSVSPVTDFLYRLVALISAVVITFGTYAAVDARFSVEVRDAVHRAVYGLEGGAGMVQAVIGLGESGIPFEHLAAAGATQDVVAADVPSAGGFRQFLAEIFAGVFDGWGSTRAKIVIDVEPVPAIRPPFSPPPAPVQQTVVEQPVRERIVERERIVSIAAAPDGSFGARLAELDARLTSQILSLADRSSSQITQVFTTASNLARIEHLDGLDLTDPTITGGTITNATITGGSVTATDFSGVLGVAKGGTGTSSVPTYGNVLIGDGQGGYALVATSTLGIIGAASSPGGSSGNIQYNNAGVFGGASALYYDAANGRFGIGTSTPYAALGVSGQVVADFYTATSTSATSTLGRVFASALRLSGPVYDATNSAGTNGYVLQTTGTGVQWVATSSLGIVGGAGGLSFGQSWEVSTNVFGQSSLAPTTTQNIAVSGVGTSTFAGGVEAWRSVAAPYFLATSSVATSTFAGGINVTNGCFAVDGICMTGGSGSVAWGSISGTLSSQTDLQTALDTRLTLTSWYATTTDALDEGSSNLYFTNARADARIALFQSFASSTNVYGQSALAPTTTQNLVVNGVGTSTFAGGLESFRNIAAPYFTATSSSATSTFVQITGSVISGFGLGECIDAADKLVYSNGRFSCGTDAGAGGGITSLGAAGQGQTGSAQTFATTSDTNIGLTITSAGNTHTFTSTWSGTLAANRGGTGIASPTAAGILVGSYAGGSWQQVATSSLGLLTTDIAEGSNLYFTNARARSALSSSATGITYDSGTGVFALTGGYVIPLSASTTEWNSFYTTPSSRITAGTGLSWSGNTLNAQVQSSDLAAYLTLNAWYATTTDGIDEGSTNLYFTTPRATANFVSNLAATTSVASITALPNLAVTAAQVSNFNDSVNSFVASSTTMPKVYTSNTFTNTNTFNGQTTLTSASATNFSALYASSTDGFFGNLSIGSLSGVLRATAGSVATALVDLANDVSGILGVSNGGTGWGTIQSGTVLLGNGVGRIATTTAGNNGDILALVGGIPTWQPTTTLATITGTLSVSKGGTGLTSYSTGDIFYASDATTLTPLSIGAPGTVLKVSGGNVPFWGTDLTTGGGGGAGAWSTTTDSLAVYPTDTSDIIIIGSNSTSTNVSILEVSGQSYFSNRVGIGTTTPGSRLSIGGVGNFSETGSTLYSQLTLGTIVGTSSASFASTTLSGATLLSNATTTNFAITGITSSLLKTNAGGTVVPAIAGTDYANFSYLFPGNATTTSIAFNGGLTGTTASFTSATSTGSSFATDRLGNTLRIGATATTSISSGGDLTVAGNTSLQRATTTQLGITGITNALLGTRADGSVYATTSIGGSFLNTTGNWTGLFDGQEGSWYIDRGNHTGTQLASTISDFSTTARGLFSSSFPIAYNSGTGAFTFNGLTTSTPATVGNLTYFSGANTLANVATSSLSTSAAFSYSGTFGALVGGTGGTLSLATNGVGLTNLAQIAGNTILGNLSGSTGNVIAFATSSLGIALGDTTGTLAVSRGGTGITATPSYGQILVGNAGGTYTLTATSSLGLPTTSDLGNYLALASWYATTTDGLDEGSTNLYFTTPRATANFISNLAATTSVASITALPNLSTIGTITSGTWQGSVIGDAYLNDALTISGGTINNTPIGATTPSTAVFTKATATNATTTNLAISGITSSLLKTNAGGTVVAAVPGTDYLTTAITAIGPGGQTQTGSTITIATSTSATNGITSALTIVGSGNTLTFTPSQSGTLTVAGGGTGATSFTGGSLVYGNGTGALQSVATTTATIGDSLSYSGTFGALVGGSAGTLSLNMGNANTWTALQTFTNASSTLFSSSYASSTNLFAGTLTIPSVASTLLKTNSGGTVVPAIAGTDYANFSYLFPGNATTTSIAFNGGLTGTTASFTSATSTNLFGGSLLANTARFGATATSTFSSTGQLTLSSSLLLSSNDAGALGASGTAFSDLFLASGGVVNWNAGDVTMTHAANTLTFNGASSGYIFSNGNVGIGTTTPGSALSIQGNIFLAGNLVSTSTATSTFAGRLQTTSLNVTSTTATSTFANGIQLSGGCFRDAAGNCIGSTVVAGANTQVIFNNSGSYAGDAGFTYNSGTDALTVTGSIAVSGTAPTFTLTDTSTTNADFVINANNDLGATTIYADANGEVVGSYLALGVAGVEGIRILDNGFVRIGNNSTPSAQLNIGSGDGDKVDGIDDLFVKDDIELDGQLYVDGTATSTFAAGLKTTVLDVTSTTATSTFANGLNITNGCFALRGVCISGTSGVSFNYPFPSNATSTLLNFNGGLTAYASSTIGAGTAGAGLTVRGTATTSGFILSTTDSATTMGRSVTAAIRIDNRTASVGTHEGIIFGNEHNANAYIGSVLTTVLNNTASDLVFGTKDTSTALNVTEYMRISAGGNVGIGTSTPSQPLTVAGNSASFTSALFNNMSSTATAFNQLQLSLPNVNSNINAAFRVTGQVSGDLFRTSIVNNNSEQLTILSGGNIGVGTTSPYAKLSITPSDTAPAIAVEGGSIIQIASTSPRVVGTVSSATQLDDARGLFVVGSYAYVTGFISDSLAILSIASSTDPQILGFVSDATLLNGAFGVHVAGHYAYVAASNGDRLTVVDVSNPMSPKVVSSLLSTDALDGVRTLYVAGRYAYLASRNDNMLTIVNIADPTNPVVVGTVTDSRIKGAEGVAVQGQYAYVTGPYASTLAVVDVSRPEHPTIVGSVTDTSVMNAPTDIVVSGRYAYVTATTTASFVIVDISNPENPQLAGSVTDGTRLTQQASAGAGIAIAGSYAYVTGSLDYVNVIDIRDPSRPSIIASVSSGTQLDGPNKIAVSGNYAYVTARLDDMFTVLELNGASFPLLQAGNIAAGSINFSDSLFGYGDAYIGGGITAGSPGIFSRGGLSVFVASSTSPSPVAGTFMGGYVGIGTTSPFRSLSITNAVSTAQQAIAYDSTRYTDLLTNSVGDFIINPQGDDAFLNDDDLWVCAGGSCPSGTPSGNGNLIVETRLGIGTSSPSALLTMQNADNSTFLNMTAGGTTRFTLGTDASGNVIGYTGSAVDLRFGSSSVPTQLVIKGNSGRVGIGTTTPTQQLSIADRLYVGAGGATGMGIATSTFQGDVKITGKLDVSTIDPPYTIDGTKYATYVASMTGVKEETTMTVQIDSYNDSSGKYEHIIAFDELAIGSDLWLFYQITDFGDQWKNLVVLITPSFDGQVFYKKDIERNALVLSSSEKGEVSLRLTAARYDHAEWLNLRPDQDGDTAGTHVIFSKSKDRTTKGASPQTATFSTAASVDIVIESIQTFVVRVMEVGAELFERLLSVHAKGT